MLLLITGAFFSCKKKEGNIILNGQGNTSQLGMYTNDTLKLEAYTMREDSLPGSGLTYSLLGHMSDPLMGKTTASIYAALTLKEPNNDFPNTEDPDSAILYFPIIDGLNFYGDRLAQQQLSIRFLGSDVDASVVYYQNYKPSLDFSSETVYKGPIFSGNYSITRYLKDTLELHPGLRIKLSADMAKRLMQMPKEAYQDNTGLAKYMKGIAITPADKDLFSGQGGIGVYDFHNQLSTGYMAKILLYYRDTQTFMFTFAGKSRTITSGSFGAYPAEVQKQLNNPGKAYEKTYVQSLQGVKTRIHIPQLLSLLNGNTNNIAINRAELTIACDKSAFSADFFAPPRLNLFRPLNPNSTRNYLLPDAAYSTFGGTYNESAGTYTFLITRYVQDIINSKFNQNFDANYGLFLAVPTASPIIAGRALLNFNDPKTKLKITYTKIN